MNVKTRLMCGLTLALAVRMAHRASDQGWVTLELLALASIVAVVMLLTGNGDRDA